MNRVVLTERQVEIIVLLAWGEPVRCIAKELYLTSATVNYHLGRLKRIFRASSLPALVAAAAAGGIITGTLPVQGTGKLEVDGDRLLWDSSVPLWSDPAIADLTEANPRNFAPEHSTQAKAREVAPTTYRDRRTPAA